LVRGIIYTVATVTVATLVVAPLVVATLSCRHNDQLPIIYLSIYLYCSVIFQIYGGSWHYMGQFQIKETVSVNKCTNMKDHTIIKLNKNLVTAQQLANLICQKLHEERDILLNNQLLDRRSRGGSPD
jgi:hypothetical protein